VSSKSIFDNGSLDDILPLCAQTSSFLTPQSARADLAKARYQRIHEIRTTTHVTQLLRRVSALSPLLVAELWHVIAREPEHSPTDAFHAKQSKANNNNNNNNRHKYLSLIDAAKLQVNFQVFFINRLLRTKNQTL
jgi:hypothetical protein